ncbi:116_t:CDS:2 [Ambispora leptoticha]|uniref:proline--tRNA ligase n=1 Tax=Ambispora leptoticha TaxID=144679 RepID=A0A9N8ZDF3_9GLOM|nr:116_t:CDS:2 [Ambispora leptoticha]
MFLPTTKDTAIVTPSSQQQHQPMTPKVSEDKKKSNDVAVSDSYRLMIRAGLIRQSSSGIYSLLPFALRALEKLEKIIEYEMVNIGAQKLSLPNLLSAEPWKQTGRWETAASELFRLQDRKESDFCLAPTHEEEITRLVAHEVSSYRHLPLRLFQIGKKYRDEMRPRFGLLRGREFIMKDLYTFDTSEETALQSYEQVLEAYKRIFGKIELPFAIVEADPGNIGGTRSHEFQFLSKAGEDTILTCSKCGYSANEEKAIGVLPHPPEASSSLDKDSLIRFGITENKKLAIILLGPGREVNSVKLKWGSGDHTVRIVDPIRAYELITIDDSEQDPVIHIFKDHTFTGPINDELFTVSRDHITSDILKKITPKLKILGDHHHFHHNISIHNGDFHNTKQGDGCPRCALHFHSTAPAHNFEPLTSSRAIEVGHTFLLGTKYSQPLHATFAPENPTTPGERRPIQMGCFGLGLTRMLAAIIEISHDSLGIVWPKNIAPYRVCIIPGVREEKVIEAVNRTFDLLNTLRTTTDFRITGNDVVIDDRAGSLGYRMKDAELIGYPWNIVLGKQFLETGKMEIQKRKIGGVDKYFVEMEEICNFIEESS